MPSARRPARWCSWWRCRWGDWPVAAPARPQDPGHRRQPGGGQQRAAGADRRAVGRRRGDHRAAGGSTSRASWWGRPSPTPPTRACRRWPSPPAPSPWSTSAATAARASTSATPRTARCGGPRRPRPRAGPCWPRPARSAPTTARRPRCSIRRPAAATPRRAADVWARGALFPYLQGVPDDVHENDPPWRLERSLDEVREAVARAGARGARLEDVRRRGPLADRAG